METHDYGNKFADGIEYICQVVFMESETKQVFNEIRVTKCALHRKLTLCSTKQFQSLNKL